MDSRYSEHLSRLAAHGGSRPARGNARMVIPKTNFALPGQNLAAGLVRRRTLRGASGSASAKRTTSYPLVPAAGAPGVPQQPGGAAASSNEGKFNVRPNFFYSTSRSHSEGLIKI